MAGGDAPVVVVFPNSVEKSYDKVTITRRGARRARRVAAPAAGRRCEERQGFVQSAFVKQAHLLKLESASPIHAFRV